MSAKFTPGPWSIDTTISTDVMGNGFIVADCECFLASDDYDEMEANARLIAAAPDLLEALKKAVACGMIPNSTAADGGATRYSEQVAIADEIRAAIAKAEGEAP